MSNFVLTYDQEIGLDDLSCRGISSEEYSDVSEFYALHYERHNIFLVEEVENSSPLDSWLVSVLPEEVGRLSDFEVCLVGEPLEDWQRPCLGYAKTWGDPLNVSYKCDGDGEVVEHLVGDSYLFTFEERTSQYADVSGLSSVPAHVENLFFGA
jgi:hypothetical protein